MVKKHWRRRGPGSEGAVCDHHLMQAGTGGWAERQALPGCPSSPAHLLDLLGSRQLVGHRGALVGVAPLHQHPRRPLALAGVVVWGVARTEVHDSHGVAAHLQLPALTQPPLSRKLQRRAAG